MGGWKEWAQLQVFSYRFVLLIGKLTQVLGPPSPPVQTLVPTSASESHPPQGTKGWCFQRLPVHAAAGCSVLGILCKRWPRAGLEVHSDTGIFLLNETRGHCSPPIHSLVIGKSGMVAHTHDPSTWEVEARGSEFKASLGYMRPSQNRQTYSPAGEQTTGTMSQTQLNTQLPVQGEARITV